MAERHIFVVHTRCAPDAEAEFNEWYDNEHLDDLVKVPGIVAAQRFELSDVQMNDGDRFPYLAIYEIEGDPQAWKDAMNRLKGSWVVSTAIAESATSLYSERGPKKVAESQRAETAATA